MHNSMKAKFALEDGSVYSGTAFASEGERSGEVVFNTSMFGYQEILTDPSYKGQIVTMTYPLIGNYGVNADDVESNRVWVEGFVVKEVSKCTSNFRSSESLQSYLKRSGVVAIEGVDTRAITKKLRVTGSMNGVISTVDLDDRSLVEKARQVPKMVGLDLVKNVTRKEAIHCSKLLSDVTLESPRFRVALLDCGVKFNILRSLVKMGCDVTVFPATTSHTEILKFKPDGVCLSNGPGDPSAVTYAIECVKGLIKKEIPIFGICLGHQILNLAFGAKVYKMKFGHHGANHPVKNLATGKIEITSHNHGFAVDEKTVNKVGLEVTHIDLNDNTVEGVSHKSLPMFSVQYHPEASPGPHDASYLFNRFCEMMDGVKAN